MNDPATSARPATATPQRPVSAGATAPAKPGPAPVATGDGRPVGREASPPSVAHLLKELGDESRLLVRQEIALAKAEMSEKLKSALRHLMVIGAGGVVLVVAALLFFTALTTGLVSLLDAVMPLDIAVWLAPLLLGVTLAIIGFAMVKKGSSELGDDTLVPHKTIDSLKEDKEWIKEHRP